MQVPNNSTLTLLILLPLLGWRLYARFKRMVGRQRLSKVRPWITLVIFPTLSVFLLWAARTHPERLALFAVSLGCGLALGIYGFGKTQLEPTKQGLFYTPNAHLGIALSLLFLGRIIFRFVEVYALDVHRPHGMEDFARSPVTLAVFGLLAGYYVSYAAQLLRWRWRVLAAKHAREAQAASALHLPAVRS